ncbi:hypothetical protein, partial [Enterobacter hormaechei]
GMIVFLRPLGLRLEEFNPADFHLGEELFSAVDETWQSLKDTFSLSVLANPIEASKGDGEMATGAMGVMGEKFGSVASRIVGMSFC